VQDLNLGSSENEARKRAIAPLNLVHHFGKNLKAKVYSIAGQEGPELRNSSTLSLTSALDGVGGQRHAPAALPPEMAQYPLYSRLGWHQGRSGRVRKISSATGIRFSDRPAHSESLYQLHCMPQYQLTL
jgi:hypothetical protein